MEKHKGLYDIHSLDPTGCEIGERVNKDFCNRVSNSSILRERLAMAEKITGNQTVVTAMLYGRDDGSVKDLPDDKQIKLQEKIMKEKKRMVSGE